MLQLVLRISVLWSTFTVVHFQMPCLTRRRSTELDAIVVAKWKHGKEEKWNQAQDLCNDRQDRRAIKKLQGQGSLLENGRFPVWGKWKMDGSYLTEASVFVGFLNFIFVLSPLHEEGKYSFKRWFSSYFNSGRSPVSVKPFFLHVD